MKRKNVLVSAYFAKNVGDDLFLKVLFDRYQHVNWYLLTANRQYKMLFKNYPHVNIIHSYRDIGTINMFISWSEMTNHFRKYDAFVMIGGSIFMQNKEWKKTYKIRNKLITLLNKSNVPSFIIGANFGPYTDDNFKTLYEHHYLKYDGICFRDLYSYHMFKHMSHVTVAPDAVLSLKVKRQKGDKYCIGISPISLNERDELRSYQHEYESKHREIIKHYVDNNYHVKIFSFCEYEGDLDSINHILNDIPEQYRDHIKIVNYTGQIDSFLNEFQSCSYIIGARFHSIMLAIKFNQPFLPIIYSDKTIHSLQKIGVKKLGYHISEIDLLTVNTIEDQFNEGHYENIYEEASEQFYHLDQVLRS